MSLPTADPGRATKRLPPHQIAQQHRHPPAQRSPKTDSRHLMCIKKHFNGIKGELRRADPLDENTIDQWDSSCRQKPYCQCCWGQQNYSNAQYKVVIFAIFAVEYEAIRPRWRAKLRVSENLLENQAVTVGRCHATANEKAALAASLAEPTEAAVGRGEFESSRSSRESANVAGPPGGEPAEQQPSEDYLKT